MDASPLGRIAWGCAGMAVAIVCNTLGAGAVLVAGTDEQKREWLSPLLTVIPGQVAAVHLARLRGADVDSPAGLSKITLTR